MSTIDSTAADSQTEEATAPCVQADSVADHGSPAATTGAAASDVTPGQDREQRLAASKRLALLVMALTLTALAALIGWGGLRIHHTRQSADQQAQILQAARQEALNLTTIADTTAEADMKRILDLSSGTFYDQIQQRSKDFVALVKQTQTKSSGVLADAAIETEQDYQAKVLVAVNVKTSTLGASEELARSWRMRLTVQQNSGAVKISDVEFVP